MSVSYEDLYVVASILNEQYIETGDKHLFVYVEKFSQYSLPRTKEILEKLDQKYEVITLATTAYDEGNGDDIYIDMSMNQIADMLGDDRSPETYDYIENVILSYGIIIEPTFNDFYKKLKKHIVAKKRVSGELDDFIPKIAKLKYIESSFSCKYGEKQVKFRGLLQREICRQVITRKVLKEPVTFYGILFEVDESKKSRAVYDAAKSVNEILEKNFGLQGVIEIDIPSEKLKFNKKYL